MKALSSTLLAMCLAAGCGGSTTVDPIFRPEGQNPNQSGGTGGTANPPGTPVPPKDPDPIAPIGPYTGLVGTTDVSILYPLPAGKISLPYFVRPSEAGVHGALFPKAVFETVLPQRRLDTTISEPTSGYEELALVSVRLDHCSARKGTQCTPEIRAVFQALYVQEELGTAATDGAIHVMHDLSETELVTTMKQILTLKQKEGGTASQILDVHPTLGQQGLNGGFAQGLRAILLEHLGANRIARVTAFDHNFHPDSDGWQFSIFDKQNDGTFKQANIPQMPPSAQQLIAGSAPNAFPIEQTNASDFGTSSTQDNVRPLVEGNGVSQTSLKKAYEGALRVQNPTLHSAETTDCGNCHLAEGAKLRGKALYGYTEAGAFTHARNLGYKSDRTSVTNLHAFGWLGRSVSIMQRTANESVIVAEWMEQKVK